MTFLNRTKIRIFFSALNTTLNVQSFSLFFNPCDFYRNRCLNPKEATAFQPHANVTRSLK